jgi:DNA-directed RNA polymerase specialized sigma24 family protein
VYQEQSPEVVARELGITPSALRTRIMRARERLRTLMATAEVQRLGAYLAAS